MHLWMTGLAVVLALAGCSTSPEAGDGSASHVDAAFAPPFTEPELAASFAPHASILAGFDPPAGKATDWRIGDQALFGIRLDARDGRTQVWFVRVEVMSEVSPGGGAIVFEAGPERKPSLVMSSPTRMKFTMDDGNVFVRDSGSIALEVTVYDAVGAEIGRSFVGAPADFLSDGFHASCLTAMSISAESSEAEKKAVFTEAFLTWITSFFGFLETFKSSPHLESLRSSVADEIVAKPSIFSAIFGVRLHINPDIDEIRSEDRALPARAENDDAKRLATDLLLNDKLAVRLDLVAVDPKPPLQVAAGVLGLEASHPSRPERRFAARLLAAKRGPEIVRTP